MVTDIAAMTHQLICHVHAAHLSHAPDTRCSTTRSPLSPNSNHWHGNVAAQSCGDKRPARRIKCLPKSLAATRYAGGVKARSVEQGVAIAQYNLGVMYDNGQGVAHDYDAAINWYLAAADQQHAGAINNLGIFFGRGDYTDKNLPLAHALYNLAASYNPSKKMYAENRDSNLRSLQQTKQVALGQEYTRRLTKSKDFEATIMEIIKPKAKAKAAKKK